MKTKIGEFMTFVTEVMLLLPLLLLTPTTNVFTTSFLSCTEHPCKNVRNVDIEMTKTMAWNFSFLYILRALHLHVEYQTISLQLLTYC